MNKNIPIYINCIQPIDLSSELWLEALDKNIFLDISKKDGYCIEWLNIFSEVNSVFRPIKSFYCANNKNKLSGELNSKNYFFNNVNIAEFLEYAKYELVFDIRLNYFILIFEIKFNFRRDIFLESILCGTNSFYDFIRNLLVKEKDSSNISKWALNIRKNSLKKISNLFQNKKLDSVKILNNTGNITFFVLDLDPNNKNFLQENLIKMNILSERLKVSSKPIFTNEIVSYNFFGRFHTIISKDINDYYRYMPFQFHIQYIWFILNAYNNLMDELNLSLLYNQDTKSIEQEDNILNELIQRIELLILYNENFIRAIEVDYDLVYKKMEKRWNIQNSLRSSKEYIAFFKNYLEREFNKKISKSQKRQNKILFIISLLQVIALLGVWNDYLSLLNKDNFKNIDSFILYIFNNNINNLLIFNIILLPIVTVLIIVLYIVFGNL